MATVSQLAAMYRQRVPSSAPRPTSATPRTGFAASRTGTQTAPTRSMPRSGYAASRMGTRTEPKTGPRGTTANDLMRVARFGLPALPRTVIPEVTAPEFELPSGIGSAVTSAFAGQPGPGYGEKYGGAPTLSQLDDMVLGMGLSAYETADLAQKQAEQAAMRYRDEMYGRVGNRLQPIASLAGVRPGANLSEQDRARLMAGYQGVREMGETEEYLAAKEREAMPQSDLFGGPTTSANRLMRQTYEQMLNARDLAPDQRAQLAERALGLGYFPEEPEFLERRLLAAPEVQGPEQVAQLLRDTPLSQYAQQIAVNTFGMDPAMAAGRYGQDMDLAYNKLQTDLAMQEAGGSTVGQQILNNYGPEQFSSYMDRLAQEAMFGSAEEQQAYVEELQAEQDRQDDEVIATTYGFYPSEFGDVPPEEVRARVADPSFQQLLQQGLDQVQEGSFNVNVANETATAWLTQTGDRIGARILQEAIAKFDLVG